MIKMLRQRPHLGVFWLVSLGSFLLIWRILPNNFSQVAFFLLIIAVIYSSLKGESRVASVATMFLVLAAINYLSSARVIPALIAALCIVGLTPLIGMAGENSVGSEERLSFHHWLLLSLFLAQINSIISLWPVSGFNRALLGGIAFYALWEVLNSRSRASREHYIKHFVFIALTVIVVIGSIIWANFPQLTEF